MNRLITINKETINKEKSAAIILSVFYLVGLLGHASEGYRAMMLSLTPYTLLGCSILVLLFSVRFSAGALIILTVTLIITFLLEALGVSTGMVFGSYHYGDVLGPKLLSVPVIISLNWLLVILGAVNLTRIFLRSIAGSHRKVQIKYLGYLIPGVLAVLLDLFLEPAAIRLGYWKWNDSQPPLQNYAAWFVIASLCSVMIGKTELKNDLPAYYFIIQLLFFGILLIIL